MRFKFKNLGPVQKAELELGDLTIICGPNNTGKTYISYSIFGFFKTWSQFADFKIPNDFFSELAEKGNLKIDLRRFEKNIPNIVSSVAKSYTKNLNKIFSAKEDEFAGTVIQAETENKQPDYSAKLDRSLFSKKKEIVHLKKEANSPFMELSVLTRDRQDVPPDEFIKFIFNSELAEIFFQKAFPVPFIITSERTGISLFYKELDITKNVLLDQIATIEKQRQIDPFEILNSLMARYALPIKENIDFIRDLEQISKNRSSVFKTDCSGCIEKILNGNFSIIDKELMFSAKNPRDARKRIKIPVYLSSAAVKSLAGINFYVKHLANKGDILIIDEPELNLHPDNQRKIARFFAMLVNNGIKVLITTHSDYIIKEFSNLIMLSNPFPEKKDIMKKYGYLESELLSPGQLRIYLADNQTLERIDPDPKSGIALETFDKVINEMNESSEEIYYSING
jgi:predicted ATP-binding protein involved in virulence